nr:actin-like isoform X2 [Peromyscus maniculatus bairdii]
MDQTPIICDYGSGFSKNLLVGTEEEDCFIGAEAQNNLVQLNLNHPITRGAIANWDNVEKIWHHSFYQALHISPEQHPVMITEPPLNSKDVKSRMTQPAARGTHEHLGSVCHLAGQHANLPPQILFETFNVPALYMANQGVLSMYAAGRTSGTTIESGEGMTYIVPIMNGYPLQLSTLKLDVAGQDLTSYLLKLLSDSGNLLVGAADREYIRDLKEKHCYVALDYDMEISKTAAPSCQKKFQLPDGKEVSMGQEAFMCSEALFNTSLIGKSNLGIHIQAQESITSCDRSYWKTLFSHIMVSGGTGAFSGLRLRLQREITNLASPDLCVKVAISPYAKYGAWVGASILCSLPMFKDMWVTSQEYREIGPSVMCRRNL